MVMFTMTQSSQHHCYLCVHCLELAAICYCADAPNTDPDHGPKIIPDPPTEPNNEESFALFCL